MTAISELDVHDDRALREFHDVGVAALRSAFPHQVVRTFDNHAMQRTNRGFGFRPVDRMHEMQSTIAPARG